MVGFELNLIRGKVVWAFVAGVSVVHPRLAIHFLERLFSLTQITISLWLWLHFLLECPSCWLRWPLTSSPSEFSIESSALCSWSNSFAGSPVFFSLRYSAWVQSLLMVVNILKQDCSFGTKAFLVSCYCSEFLVERTLWAFRGTNGFYCLNTRG